jgi:hypothetical protein
MRITIPADATNQVAPVLPGIQEKVKIRPGSRIKKSEKPRCS